MKKSFYVLSLFILIFFSDTKVKASHAMGAEIMYEWTSDSTYRIYYRFYKDCSGIKEDSIVTICLRNSCRPGWDTTIILSKAFILPAGITNGKQIFPGCPSQPTYCDGGTLPGYREWWYANQFTFPSRCNFWTLSHSELSRNSIANFPGGGNLYVEATLNNLDAPGNSSACFSVLPNPYYGDASYTYNAGALDPNNDSLYFEMIAPQSGFDCAPSSMTWGAGYGLPSNPLATGSTFSFDNIIGQMSYRPNARGQYALAERVSEYKYVPDKGWVKAGSIVRDIMVVIFPSSPIQPSLTTVASSISGATIISGTIFACGGTNFNFCFDAKTADISAVLVVTDNDFAWPTYTKPHVSYSHMYTDSVRGCFSWTPGVYDTGLRVLCVSVKDSSCKTAQYSNTFSIPMRVLPGIVAHASKSRICSGDSVVLAGTGGTGYTWGVVSGGSSITSLSCIVCSPAVAKPTLTTSYTLTGVSTYGCNTNDTIKIIVDTLTPAPSVYISTIPALSSYTAGATIQFNANATGTFPSTTYQWLRNGTIIPGATSNIYTTSTLTTHDVISVVVHNNKPCSVVDTAVSNTFPLSVYQVPGSDMVHIYPNPNNGSFSITGNLDIPDNIPVQIEITNTLGQIVYQDRTNVISGHVNKQVLLGVNTPQGLYYVKVIAGNNFWASSLSVIK